MNKMKRPSISEMLEIKDVAIVGVSAKLGYYWAHSMLQWPHDLNVWLVSRRGGEVRGKEILTDLNQVPNNIDYAIVAVPYKYVPDVIEQCSRKGAKGVTVFTSGFSELGTDEGNQREKELGELVFSLPLRMFGPNCMGLCYPKLGFAFMPTVEHLPGDVGFLSQSGGVAISTYTAGVESGVGFSKVFSFGNAVDIKPAELLEFFIDDEETSVVGAYIEGTKQGKELLRNLRLLAAKKPVVVLKGGQSDEGSRVVSSHTGALAGSNEIWESAFRQANVTTVETLEDLVASLSIYSKSPVPSSRNIGMVTISGGTSVIYTDLAIKNGLKVPSTDRKTREDLDPLIRDVGTSLGNPIDLAADYYSDQTISEVIRIVGNDPGFDSIIIEADAHHIHQVSTIMDAADVVEYFWKSIASASEKVVEETSKPVLVAVPEVAYQDARMEAWNIFVEHGLPVFRNIREVVTAISRACDYYERREIRQS